MQIYKKIRTSLLVKKTHTKLLKALFFYCIFLLPIKGGSAPFAIDFNHKKKAFNSSKISSVPRIFHFIWIGPTPFPIESLKNLISFKKHHKKARFIFWSDKPIEPLLDFLEVKVIDPTEFKLQSYYEKSQNVGQKADIARFEILYKYGGIYADHDAICTQSLDPLIDHFDFVAGAEAKGKNLGIGLLMSKPHHRIFKSLIHRLLTLFDSNDVYIAKKNDKRAVLDSTYGLFTKTVFDLIDTNDLVTPSFYFYPKNQRPLFSKHLYKSYWIEDFSVVKRNEANSMIKNNYYWIKLSLLFSLLSFGFIVKSRFS